MRTRAKVDTNQTAIVRALRRCGYSVLSLAAIGDGCPDLLVAGSDGWTCLMEVKAPKGKLTPDQQRFCATWSGPIFIVKSVDEAVSVAIGFKDAMTRASAR